MVSGTVICCQSFSAKNPQAFTCILDLLHGWPVKLSKNPKAFICILDVFHGWLFPEYLEAVCVLKGAVEREKAKGLVRRTGKIGFQFTLPWVLSEKHKPCC